MSQTNNNIVYKKQIILIGNKREPLAEELQKNGFYVKWCPFDLEHIMKIRDSSNIMIIYTTDEDEDNLKRICLYLRDLCLEEEKILYIYGNKIGVDIVRSVIPSIFIEKSSYFYSEPFSNFTDDLNKLIYPDDKELPGLLIIDDDVEYISKLRPYLDGKFQIYVNHLDLNKALLFLPLSDVLLINAEASFTLFEFVEFIKAVSVRKKKGSLNFYYLTENDERRDRMNSGSELSSIALSKSVDVSKTASFLLHTFAN